MNTSKPRRTLRLLLRAVFGLLALCLIAVLVLWATAPGGFQPKDTSRIKNGMTREQVIEVLKCQPSTVWDDIPFKPEYEPGFRLFLKEWPEVVLTFESEAAEIAVYFAHGRVIGSLGNWKNDSEPIQFKLLRWVEGDFR